MRYITKTQSQSGATLEASTNFCCVLVIVSCNLNRLNEKAVTMHGYRNTCLLVEHTVAFIDIRDVSLVLVRPLPRELALLVDAVD